MMEQWKKLLSSLSVRQRILIGAAAVLVVAGIFAFTRWRKDQDFKPLFTGVAPEEAALVTQKLKETSVEYRLGGESGSTILVPSEKLAEVRLQMAASGLPKSGRVGFELFDKTNLGTTEFAEHINYARAVEGELERSIRHIREIEQARVHLTFPKDSVFLESREPAKASVLVSLKQGASLSPQNVLAICHLVASAVEGLDAKSVSIVDTKGTLLNRPRKAGDTEDSSQESLEYRAKLERDLLLKINRTLDPLLGPEKFRASVALDIDRTSGEESTESYDPEKTVMLNTTKSEESSGQNGSAGVPGTPSSLPRPAVRSAAAGSSVLRRSETVAYQPAKTVRHTRIPEGAVTRMSVALLIDQSVRWERNGNQQKRILVPPAPETLKSIREVVAASIALDATRGDQLVVESLPFEQTLISPPPAADTQQAPVGQTVFAIPVGSVDGKVLIGVTAGVLLALAGIFLLSRKIKLGRKKTGSADQEAIGAPANDDQKNMIEAHTQELTKSLHDKAEQKRKLLMEAQEKLKLEPLITQKSEILVNYLRDAIKADPTTAASVIRDWLHEE